MTAATSGTGKRIERSASNLVQRWTTDPFRVRMDHKTYVNHRHINNNKTANIKDKNKKVYFGGVRTL